MSAERVVWTYWISRNSRGGVLSPYCRVWYIKPQRERRGNDVQWFSTGYLAEQLVDDTQAWSRTIPETDLELIRLETYPTEQQLAEQKKA